MWRMFEERAPLIRESWAPVLTAIPFNELKGRSSLNQVKSMKWQSHLFEIRDLVTSLSCHICSSLLWVRGWSRGCNRWRHTVLSHYLLQGVPSLLLFICAIALWNWNKNNKSRKLKTANLEDMTPISIPKPNLSFSTKWKWYVEILFLVQLVF